MSFLTNLHLDQVERELTSRLDNTDAAVQALKTEDGLLYNDIEEGREITGEQIAALVAENKQLWQAVIGLTIFGFIVMAGLIVTALWL